MPLACPCSLVAFFLKEVHQNIDACDVLPQLAEVLGRDRLSAVQFPRNGAIRVTFVDTPSCDAVLQSGLQFGASHLCAGCLAVLPSGIPTRLAL